MPRPASESVRPLRGRGRLSAPSASEGSSPSSEKTRRVRSELGRFARVLAGGALVLTAGCAAESASRSARDYNAGRYWEAQRLAEVEAGAAAGVDRQRAALVAGLAAHAQGEHAEAQRWLGPLRSASDPSIAGRAQAGLGLIHLERGEYRQAAALLSEAASKLTGDDAARAGHHAGQAYAAIGRLDAAHLQYNLALSAVSDPDLRDTLIAQLDRSAYTVQLGAFANRANAQRAARRFASLTAGLGLGEPTVRAERSARRTLYLVQVGRFSQKDQAVDAKRRIGGEAIIAAVQTSD